MLHTQESLDRLREYHKVYCVHAAHARHSDQSHEELGVTHAMRERHDKECARLSMIIARAHVVPLAPDRGTVVRIGSVVQLKVVAKPSGQSHVRWLEVGGFGEAQPGSETQHEILGYNSPLGQKLIGHKVGFDFDFSQNTYVIEQLFAGWERVPKLSLVEAQAA